MQTEEYRKGHQFAKAYFYVQRGLSLVNDFRYLFAGVLAMYVLMKFDNLLWFVVMFSASIPVLILMGWFNVHKMAKVLDWLGIEYSTYFGKLSFTYQEKIIDELEKLNKK